MPRWGEVAGHSLCPMCPISSSQGHGGHCPVYAHPTFPHWQVDSSCTLTIQPLVLLRDRWQPARKLVALQKGAQQGGEFSCSILRREDLQGRDWDDEVVSGGGQADTNEVRHFNVFPSRWSNMEWTGHWIDVEILGIWLLHISIICRLESTRWKSWKILTTNCTNLLWRISWRHENTISFLAK